MSRKAEGIHRRCDGTLSRIFSIVLTLNEFVTCSALIALFHALIDAYIRIHYVYVHEKICTYVSLCVCARVPLNACMYVYK